MNHSIEYQERIDENLALEAAYHRNLAMARHCSGCPQCGTVDGMDFVDIGYFPKVLNIHDSAGVRKYLHTMEDTGIEWYTRADAWFLFFFPCPVCKPTPPPEYQRLWIRPRSWARLIIEDGEAHWDSAGGKWYTAGKFEAIRESNDLEVICEEELEVSLALAATAGTNIVYTVTLNGVSWNFDPPGWFDSGYDIGAYWIEYESVSISPTCSNCRVNPALPGTDLCRGCQEFEALKVFGTDCNCVLPEQSCSVCRAAARAVAGEEILP